MTGVTYQGGPLINHVAAETVYLGAAWTSDPALEQDASRLDQFFGAVTDSGYLDMLAQYSTPQGGQIGRGTFAGRWSVPEDIWTAGVIDDQTIRELLTSEIAAGAIPPPDGNTLLFVFTPPNVVVTQGNEASNGTPVGFAGYHDHFVDLAGSTVYYAVIPDPIGNDRFPGLSADDQQTTAASHELAEAITDPAFTSWWDDSGDANTGMEIADFADPSTDTVYLGPFAVERVLSNQLGGLETPPGATLAPTASLPPPSSSGTQQQLLPIPPDLAYVAREFTQVSGFDAAFVSAAYEEYLGRSADASGMNYWLGQMHAGMSADAVDAAVLASAEYVGRQGGGDLGWLDCLYRDVLGRAPDAAGQSYWANRLQAGVDMDTVALAFTTSFERESIVVGNDYEKFLGESAAPAAVAYWAGQLQQAGGNAALVASLIGSPQYYNDPAKGNSDDSDWVASVYRDLFSMQAPVGEAAWWVSQLEGHG